MDSLIGEGNLEIHIESIVDYAASVGPDEWTAKVQEMIDSTDNMAAKDIIQTACVGIMYKVINKAKQLEELGDG